MYSAKSGDRFTFELVKGEYLSGRLLLDVGAQCIAPRRLKPGSQLAFFKGAVLIEVYGVPMKKRGIDDSRLLIPSLFLPASGFTTGRWKVVDNRPVDPAKVDFPAAIATVESRTALVWGELALPIELTPEERERIDIGPTIHTSEFTAMCLVALGREAELDRDRYPEIDWLRLARTDLRMSPHGPDVFARAGLPAEPVYFEEAYKRGFDTFRFYSDDPRTPFLVCPYCWARRTPDDLCWACGEDTTRDAAVEVSQDELDSVERKACPRCKSQIPVLATKCSSCRLDQPDDE